jgi:enediyne biosynthesis protein E4
VKGSEGFGATSPYRQHMGLGSHDKIDSLEVRWPSGITHKFEGVAANQILKLKEDEKEYKKIN